MRKMPKPRDLPLGEVARVLLNKPDSLIKRSLPGEIVQNFPVSEGLPGFAAHILRKRTYFFKQSLGKHRFHPAINTFVQERARDVKPDDLRGLLTLLSQRGTPLALPFTYRLSG